MPFSPSRRTLPALIVAAILAIMSPGIARATPFGDPGEARGLVRKILDGATGWVRTFLTPVWQATGSGLDPNGGPTPNGDTGSGLDPDGRPTSNSDSGSGLDPNG